MLKLYSILILLLLGLVQGTQASSINFHQNNTIHNNAYQDDGFWLAYDLESCTHFFEQFEVTEQRENIDDDNHINYHLGGILQILSKLSYFSTKLLHEKHLINFKFGANPYPLFIIFHSWKFHI